MGELFTSPARPFYQSTAIMDLRPINALIYAEFIKKHFEGSGKKITEDTIQEVYNRFEGITWYIQFVANVLYTATATGEICTVDKVDLAIDNILLQLNFTYSSL